MLNKILLFLKPIQILMQKLGRKETIITSEIVNNIKNLIEPGDILLSYEAQRFTSLFIKGNFDHAAIVTSRYSVMEAVGDQIVDKVNHGGVREVDLTEWLYKKDHVAIVRPIYPDQLLNKLAAANSFFYKGLGYDYGFRISADLVYCSELVYLCYEKDDKEFMGHVGDRQILPIEYLEMCDLDKDKFKLVFNTRNT